MRPGIEIWYLVDMVLYSVSSSIARRVAASALVAILLLPAPGHAQLKAVDPLFPIRSAADVATAPARPAIRLVAPINGYASAPALLTTRAGETAPVQLSALTTDQGNAALATIQIRYAIKADAARLAFDVYSAESDSNVTVPYYDTLQPAPDNNDTLQPIWLTVHIDPAARAGTYRGQLQAGSNALPVVLEIAPWTCPPPRDWTTHVGVLSSPETLALHYGVELWSEKHWDLVSRELEFVGGLGNDDVWLSIYPRNHMGQIQPWLRFKREGERLVPDFSILARYLDLYSKRVGPPHAVLVELWNSGRYSAVNDGGAPSTPVLVDGKPETVALPGFKGGEAIWPQLLDGLRREIQRQGWPDSSLLLGCADDLRPEPAVINFFKTNAPALRWAVWTHGRGDPSPWKGQLWLGALEIGHYEHLFCPWVGAPRNDGIAGGWDLDFPEYATARNYLFKYARPAQYRGLAEGTTVNIRKPSNNMSRSGAGFTRLALDFWPVADKNDPDAPPRSLLLAYEKTPWSIFYRNNTRSVVEPGADGPLGTVRYEMLREGLQESEARIVIEKALATKAIKGELATECREFLSARLRVRENDWKFKGGHPGNTLGAEDRLWGVAPHWQDSTMQLFTLAAKAAQSGKQ